MGGSILPKTILIIGAGIEQVPAIKLAKSMGLRVVVTDGNQSAPGFEWADDFAVISTYDCVKTVSFARDYSQSKNRLDGVITVASDVPLTVAAVAQELGLPGHSLETAKIATHKLLMKEKFSEFGVPIPSFKEIRDVDELKGFIKIYQYPVVIKPMDSRGARGVLRLTESTDLSWAFAESRKASPLGRVMVEDFLEGLQISSESIIYDGQIFTPGLANRNYEYLEKYAPYIIENGGDLPVLLDEVQKQELNRVLLKAAEALGISRGSLKGDIVLTRDGFKIIEVAARLSGGWFATDEIPLSSGVNVVEAVINIALGIKFDFSKLSPKYSRGVALRYLFVEQGRIDRITGLEEVEKMSFVKKIGINLAEGTVIEKMSDHTKRLGFVITEAETRQAAIDYANQALKSIKVNIGNASLLSQR
ncbi:hypothetical protein A2291_00005 [candidate division WOR-1 bacterium RIFOXYB2_FULL_42_35]|uniref:ATP-grasp domain-containing protein n=1 Tax=candidate division WOR-1 bacterium RIFOXYC2_FULL_41_25 TaxID=1802586 RepID=A0A1F4TMK8_UNCSA|nr:MAG: hypothetical protein A2247_05525 [candidate division WOR-1 bacterium RIFOXYA2_FULL_41_14]OGC24150.1 MAG: hypothetical protein A2291_00005 [candidate division WOR-1 bacterium RIFOXYB2_FULL_42_35]OGC33837.1 MAG: hypothetical protein A2462_01680 [candidate division WOR-1 bacterium RIFOXYC2_FULL_41_25]